MAYTYLIGWSALDRYYYGVRYAKNANPSDLWESYFTSSKYVKGFANKHGKPDIIDIRKIFKSRESALEWEHKVLRRMKVTSNDIWLNMTTNRGILPSSEKRIPYTLEHKTNISKSLKGRKCHWLEGNNPAHSDRMTGGGNSRAISFMYNGKKYDTIKECVAAENISYYFISKMINRNEIAKLEKETNRVLN